MIIEDVSRKDAADLKHVSRKDAKRRRKDAKNTGEDEKAVHGG